MAIVITVGAVITILLILFTTYVRYGLPPSNYKSNNENQAVLVERPQATNDSAPAATPTPTVAVSPTTSSSPGPTASPVIIPLPVPTITPTKPPSPSPTPTSKPLPGPTVSPEQMPSASLIIPVAGIGPEQLRDTFNEARSEGRAHEALDIAAPRGTPVLAAADGTIVKLHFSERGGITIYQLGTDNRTVYYYAHLERYADGIYEKQFMKQGKVIGYVGDTGNAGLGNYHLHFAIWIVPDPKKFWHGTNINPYELLKRTP